MKNDIKKIKIKIKEEYKTTRKKKLKNLKYQKNNFSSDFNNQK
jgi:hypothetical protein